MLIDHKVEEVESILVEVGRILRETITAKLKTLQNTQFPIKWIDSDKYEVDADTNTRIEEFISEWVALSQTLAAAGRLGMPQPGELLLRDVGDYPFFIPSFCIKSYLVPTNPGEKHALVVDYDCYLKIVSHEFLRELIRGKSDV